MTKLIFQLAAWICILFALELHAQSNLDYLDHQIISATENSIFDQAEAISVTRSPFSSQYFSRFSAEFQSDTNIDLSLGTTPEFHIFTPLCSSCIQTVYRFHDTDNLSETFSLLVKKSSPAISNSISAAGFQYGPAAYMIELILDTMAFAYVGSQLVQNESSIYKAAELMLFDYSQSMFYSRSIKFKDVLKYVPAVRIDRAKYTTLIGNDTYCLDFSFSDTIIVTDNSVTDTLFSLQRSTYLHAIDNDFQEYRGTIEYDGYFVHQISAVIDNWIYRVFEISGTANLEPEGVYTYSTIPNQRELIMVKYGPEGNVMWVKVISAFEPFATDNPGNYIVKMVPNDDYLSFAYYFRGNPNGGNITGTFYAFSNSDIVEASELMVSGQYRNSPFYLNMLTASEGETIKSYAARFTENPTSFAMRLAGNLDIDYFDQGYIALHCHHSTMFQSALSVKLVHPEISVISEGNLPAMPLQAEFYIVPVAGLNQPEKTVITALQETNNSTLKFEITPYGENQFLFSGFFGQTIHMNFLNNPSLTLSNLPDPYFGIDALVLIAEKPVNAIEKIPVNEPLVYPNPAYTNLFIESQINHSEYVICDITGREVKKGNLHPQQGIEVSELPSGMYILRLSDQSQQQITTLTFVKE